MSSGATESERLDSGARLALKRIVTIAWLSILLGLVMQLLLLFAKVSFDEPPESMKLVLDVVNGVTWAFFVCAGIGLGTAASKGNAIIGGLIGLVAAPVAMGLAKAAQKSMASIMKASDAPALVPLTTLGVFRAIEYGFLGWALAYMVAKEERRASRFLIAGGVTGGVFGGGITLLTPQLASQRGIILSAAQIAAIGLNEIVFPAGCAMVVYVALVVGQHLKLLTSGTATRT